GSYLIFDRSRNRVVAELDKKAGAFRSIQLPAGDYFVKKRLPSAVLIQKIALPEDRTIAVSENQMHTVPYEEDVTKGRPSKTFQPTWKYGSPFLGNTAYTMRRGEKSIGLKSLAYGLNDDVTLLTSFWIPSLSAKYRLLHQNQISLALHSGYSIDVFSLRDTRYTGIFLTTGASVSWRFNPSWVSSMGFDWELESWNKDDSSSESLYSLWGSTTWMPTENDLLQVVGRGTSDSSWTTASRSYAATVQYARRWGRMRAAVGVEYSSFDTRGEWLPVFDLWWRW
ncbi:MAG: hypothetical protein VX278_07110, partial [Myxococcota bacterium]|nr:hypothetical protein [Myxococcota bacterium]